MTVTETAQVPGTAQASARIRALRERLGPLLRQDLTTRGAYVSDASLYRRLPAAVLEPRDAGDIRAGLELAQLHGWSVVARGGGTSVAGNAIGEGLVIDTSRHLDRILQIDPQARLARVQPGVVCDQLRAAAAPHGLTYGPDPSTHSRCTIGGMVANNACGSHSVAWGTSASNLISVTLMLADGREVTLRAGGTGDETLDAGLRQLREENLALLRLELGRFPRQVSGYGLHYLLPEHHFDTAKAVAGSEGTLGVITELTVSLVERPLATALAVLAFPTVFDAAAAAPALRRPGVATIEGMGGDLLDALRSQPGNEDAGADLPGLGALGTAMGRPADEEGTGGWLYCETTGATPEEAKDLARRLVADTPQAAESVVVTDPARVRALWRIREASAGIVTRLPDGGEAWPGWEDSAVPPEHLADYLRDLYALMAQHGLRGIPFGHFGEGCVHLRLSFTPGTQEGVAVFRAFLQDAAALVHRHGGSLSGEHGDGRARSELLATMYSPEAREAFRRFKAVFDPGNVFNPGVLVDPEPLDERLRPGPGQRTFELRPVHALSRDGGSLVNAVNRCVGVGACRSMEGAMCPSFHVTRDEVHSTRGRARLLSEMLRGESIPDGFRSAEVKDALDLCLSCKACASECPVNVDMATYKAEFLHRHYEGRVRPLAHYSMGWLPAATRLLHKVPGAAAAVNAAMRVPGVEWLTKTAAGVDRSRRMLSFAPRSLQELFLRRRTGGRGRAAPDVVRAAAAAADARPAVVLWPDSFTNHLDTGPGQAAIEVLEALGYRVEMPAGAVCCGLTWHSTGQLGMVKRVLAATLDVMEPYLAAGLPVIGLEPSCHAMLAHEAAELLPDDPRAARLQELVAPFATVVARHLPGSDLRLDGMAPPVNATVPPSANARPGEDGAPVSRNETPTRGDVAPGDRSAAQWPFGRLDIRAVGQVHCHERSVGDHDPASEVLKAIGVDERTIETGCCGLAGNWGFEPGHAELSLQLGERELFPAIRKRGAGDLILADGFSCRTQVRQGTGADALHLAEVLRRALR
ncbi:FAD-binding and (Fe-S)-binding domain-containing protein [Sediminivirga luteola]|uniref:FAD-binding and (Fe-S)-binding domain-containing protein n=1 Tax=Sediminivirga luteola TaxID=1774748 RepID=UPI001F58B3A1|nr:FAD-binding and (Fe-S)-binding domain-containing protein [Sediminivirga luteola]MCI2265150.1 FAD-binding oxidoreductase [Sediminivirga luteola]